MERRANCGGELAIVAAILEQPAIDFNFTGRNGCECGAARAPPDSPAVRPTARPE
jgi:hypothetical protein